PGYMRTVGVEEELLLVDAESGRPRSVAARTLRYVAETAESAESGDASGDSESAAASGDVPGGSLDHELQQQQVEIDTVPHTNIRNFTAVGGGRDRGQASVSADGRALRIDHERAAHGRMSRARLRGFGR